MSYKKKLLRANSLEQLEATLRRAIAHANDVSTNTRQEWEAIVARRRLEFPVSNDPLSKELTELAKTITAETDLKMYPPYLKPKEKNV